MDLKDERRGTDYFKMSELNKIRLEVTMTSEHITICLN
jgi:hypothetical protein